ncbi:MAG: sterol desaturase family protein [Synechococcales cyanobacterium CRU_2_2]|nr:sterol desaturase family protein [Synechococcales cyanobacterium CRU_2_2]
MELLTNPIALAKYLLTGMLIYGVFMVAERIRPVERHQPLSDLWFNLRWYVLYTVFSLLFQVAGLSLIVSWLQSFTGAPLFDIPQPQTGWEYGAATFFYFAVTDFFYYWFHRCQHKLPVLWEQHKLHHSDRSLNVTSSRRVHWLEEPLLVFFLSIPMGLLFGFSGLELGLLAFTEMLWLHFIHMNLKLNLRQLSSWVTGPQYHRIHHSFQDQHLDKNFAAFFPFWDILFGTYHAPQYNEFPETGLHNGTIYNRLWEATLLPFRAWAGPDYLGRYFKRRSAKTR